MPKISKRRCQHGQNAPRSPSILSQAHKVSFEENNSQDGSASPSSSSSSSQSPSPIPRTSPCRNMTRLLERTPTELADMSVEEASTLNVTTASQEMSSSVSLWGQFVDVIPDDSDYRDVQYETCTSPHHSSPAYHPYLHPSKSARKSSSSHLLLPSKNTKTKKLQQKRALMDVEGALEQLRF